MKISLEYSPIILSLIIFYPIQDGWTPLHLACREGFIEIVDSLLQRNVDFNVTTTQKRHSDRKVVFNIFIFLCSFCFYFVWHDGLIDFFFQEIGSKSTPLHISCRYGQVEITKLLMKQDKLLCNTQDEV